MSEVEASSLECFNTMTPHEMEFNAEYEEVEIVPNFGCDRGDLDFVEGPYGPFQPQRVTNVPLWLALFLKRRRKCTIQMPEWLKLERLDQKLEEERTRQDGFEELPFYFSEMSTLLFREAKDDVAQLHLVRERVADLLSVRRNKVFKGLAKLQSGNPVELTHICNVEVCLIRTFMQNALGRFHKHGQAEADAQVCAAAAAAASAAPSASPRAAAHPDRSATCDVTWLPGGRRRQPVGCGSSASGGAKVAGWRVRAAASAPLTRPGTGGGAAATRGRQVRAAQQAAQEAAAQRAQR